MNSFFRVYPGVCRHKLPFPETSCQKILNSNFQNTGNFFSRPIHFFRCVYSIFHRISVILKLNTGKFFEICFLCRILIVIYLCTDLIHIRIVQSPPNIKITGKLQYREPAGSLFLLQVPDRLNTGILKCHPFKYGHTANLLVNL